MWDSVPCVHMSACKHLVVTCCTVYFNLSGSVIKSDQENKKRYLVVMFFTPHFIVEKESTCFEINFINLIHVLYILIVHTHFPWFSEPALNFLMLLSGYKLDCH